MAPEFRRSRASQRASITLVALCISTAMGIALVSYITLCTRSMEFSRRNAQQEMAVDLAQVGLEEALWALNQNTWTSSGPSGSTAWTTSGANRTATLTYPMSGNTSGTITITIANYASTGPTWPTITVNATMAFASNLTRTSSLQATTQPAPLFGNAIASSESYVSFVGGGTVDSWNSNPDNDSATPMVAYSFTAGNATNYNAVVAGNTNSNGTYGVLLTQTKVLGYVATTGLPVSSSTSGSPPGRILGPSTSAGVDVDTTRIGKSAFIPLASTFSTTLPAVSGGGGGLLASVVNLVASLLALPSSGGTLKYTGTLKLDGTLLTNSLTIDKPTKLIVDGDLNLTSVTILGITTNGKITVTATGSLEIYVTGDLNIGGLGIINQTNDPKKCAIFCTDSSTTNALVFNTTQNFCGVVFSENKPIDIQQNATFSGALLSRQYVRFSNSATAPIFHYDSALRQTRFSPVSTPYLIGQITKL